MLTADASILIDLDKIAATHRRCGRVVVMSDATDSQNEIAREANPGDSSNSLVGPLLKGAFDERPLISREAVRALQFTSPSPA